MVSKYLEQIREYNGKLGFTQEQLKLLLESNSGLENILNDLDNIRDAGFLTRLNQANYKFPYEELGEIKINNYGVELKKTKNKSYGENEVDLYLYDIFEDKNNGNGYIGTFIIRHGKESKTYFALKKYEADHNLKRASNLNKVFK